jgi:DNA repair exonuclease SbcCD ATPase subunit
MTRHNDNFQPSKAMQSENEFDRQYNTNQVLRRLESELAEANKKIQLLLDHCQDAECPVCSQIICKHHDSMHFHHDGCPSCLE